LSASAVVRRAQITARTICVDSTARGHALTAGRAPAAANTRRARYAVFVGQTRAAVLAWRAPGRESTADRLARDGRWSMPVTFLAFDQSGRLLELERGAGQSAAARAFTEVRVAGTDANDAGRRSAGARRVPTSSLAGGARAVTLSLAAAREWRERERKQERPMHPSQAVHAVWGASTVPSTRSLPQLNRRRSCSAEGPCRQKPAGSWHTSAHQPWQARTALVERHHAELRNAGLRPSEPTCGRAGERPSSDNALCAREGCTAFGRGRACGASW
jgi:hypothetical protein